MLAELPIPEAGDFCCISVGGAGGVAIGVAEWLGGAGDVCSQFEHVFLYVGGMNVVEAEPGGARLRKLTTFYPRGQRLVWSGSVGMHGPFTLLDQNERRHICETGFDHADTKGHPGTPYSALDYLSLAMRRFHIPVPGLRAYIKDSGHMICSQLVDYCYQQGGVELFSDGRWNGDVTPSDMARLLIENGATQYVGSDVAVNR